MAVTFHQKLYKIKNLPTNYFDVIFYKEYNHKGAFPVMIRNTFQIRTHSESVFHKVKSKDKCLLMSTSSLFTFFSCLFLRIKGNNITIVPLGQLHSFLDNDNPFEFGDEFGFQGWELKPKSSRRLNGKKSFKTFLRKNYRWLWKKVFVKLMLLMADNVLVLSNYEVKEVRKIHSNVNLVRLAKWFYNPYKKDGIQLELDENKLNLIYWGRIDVYYKGLDILVKAMKDLNKTVLYVSGGDYRGGMGELRELIKTEGLNNIIIEEEIISYKNLTDFDFMVLPSRWEGYFRAPHDAKANNLNVICRDVTNYDFFLTDKDIEFSTDHDLINLLKKIEELKK